MVKILSRRASIDHDDPNEGRSILDLKGGSASLLGIILFWKGNLRHLFYRGPLILYQDMGVVIQGQRDRAVAGQLLGDGRGDT